MKSEVNRDRNCCWNYAHVRIKYCKNLSTSTMLLNLLWKWEKEGIALNYQELLSSLRIFPL